MLSQFLENNIFPILAAHQNCLGAVRKYLCPGSIPKDFSVRHVTFKSKKQQNVAQRMTALAPVDALSLMENMDTPTLISDY